ncbi:glycosyltransferase family 4 protein [Evansella sp. AB-rgal1]|uniref:glycosyltransferase family 4 protein n=1 Tax=Evansella sp. AB-rgal1 TaxID=3242696 RepID=UPI00359CF797
MKKKLAIVAHNINNRGGMEIHLSEMIKRKRKDFDITVIATEFTGNYPDVHFIKIPIPQRPVFLKSLLFTFITSFILLMRKFDCVHTTGAIVLNRVDISTVHFCHRAYNSLGYNDRVHGAKSFAHKINTWFQGKFALLMESICYRPNHIPHLIVVSEHVKEEILTHFQYTEDQVSIVYNGVDTTTFKPATEEEKREYKKMNGIPEDALVFVFVGGDWSRKGLRIILEAFEGLKNKYPQLQAKILVVGKGDAKKVLEGFGNNVSDHVIFQGFHENPSLFYKMSDIYVLPSLYETFSIASLEAGACGLPVVMTKVGISNIVAEDGVTGFTVEREKESLQHAFEKLALDVSLREKMSKEVRLRSEAITWDKTYELFMHHYKRLVT